MQHACQNVRYANRSLDVGRLGDAQTTGEPRSVASGACEHGNRSSLLLSEGHAGAAPPLPLRHFGRAGRRGWAYPLRGCGRDGGWGTRTVTPDHRTGWYPPFDNQDVIPSHRVTAISSSGCTGPSPAPRPPSPSGPGHALPSVLWGLGTRVAPSSSEAI